ncbi:MAG TPA: NADPH-dependent oxidoreductase [Clostridiales bacterium]|jgi:nitroreductase/FMN reductase (NADPH)|nr:NADPH-dependent oxidoreductase [Clostridiales bacterium]
MNETVKMLLNHTSIRKYKDKPIDRDTVDMIIKCAQMAPTSSHFQAYTIIEVRDRKKIDTLYEVSGGQRWVKEAPLVLLFCADLYRGSEYFENTDKAVFGNTECYTVAVIDAAIAMQKAFIAAQSLGLGGVVVGGIRNDVAVLSDQFKLPDMVAPLFLLCLGYPDETPGLKPRLPQEEIHKIDYYDNSRQSQNIEAYNETMKQYYIDRTGGETSDRWTEHCGKALMSKTRDDVGVKFRKKGMLLR